MLRLIQTSLGRPRELTPGAQHLVVEDYTILQAGEHKWEHVPSGLRREIWRLHVMAHEQPPSFDLLLARAETILSQIVKVEIRKDVPRSFPEFAFFSQREGQQCLEDVLLAYAVCDPEVGYCQGLNFLVGLILMYTEDRELAFNVLHVLLIQRGMRVLYLPDMKAVQENICDTFEHLPVDLVDHLKGAGVPGNLFLTSWLMTCYAAEFPASFCARIVDCMLEKDWRAILVSTAVTLMTVAKQRLLCLNHMEDILHEVKAALPTLPIKVLHDLLCMAFDQARKFNLRYSTHSRSETIDEDSPPDVPSAQGSLASAPGVRSGRPASRMPAYSVPGLLGSTTNDDPKAWRTGTSSMPANMFDTLELTRDRIKALQKLQDSASKERRISQISPMSSLQSAGEEQTFSYRQSEPTQQHPNSLNKDASPEAASVPGYDSSGHLSWFPKA